MPQKIPEQPSAPVFFLSLFDAEQPAQDPAQGLGALDHNYLHMLSPAFPFSAPSYACGRQNVPASEKGFDEVLLLGGLGGRRVEHTLANLCTGLGLEKRGVRATLLDERSRITYVISGTQLR